MKKILVVILFMSLFCCYSSTYASIKDFDIESKYAVVIDFDSARVLYEKNAHEKTPMASLTKMMTAILLVENCNMDDEVEVPKEATYIGGSEVGLKAYDTISVKSLLYGMMLPSGNDAAYTSGLYLGGTVERFAKMMNDKADMIGAKNTHFTNPHGLDDENHYSTAYDMALITRYALKNKYINEAVRTKVATLDFGSSTKTLTNTNRLLRQYDFIDGVKTGYTDGAGRCLILSGTKGDARYIAVVLGADTTDFRFNNALAILNLCFEKYEKKDISKLLNFYINIPIYKGKLKCYERKIDGSMSLPLAECEYEKIYVKQDIIENINAPMQAGQVLGNISVYIDDEKIYNKDIILEESIEKNGVFDYFKKAFTYM